MWITPASLPVQPNTPYLLRYRGKLAKPKWGGTAWGEFEGVGARYAITSEGWGAYAFAAVMPSDQVSTRLRLGQCAIAETVYFDDVEARPCVPLHPRVGSIPLGAGESLHTNVYAFDLRMRDLRSNHAPCLYAHTAAFRGDEWSGKWYWILTGSKSVTYRHRLEGHSLTNARVAAALYSNYGSELIIDVSSDGTNWLELVRFSSPVGSMVETPVPAGLLPAKEIYVRLQSSGSPALHLDRYRFEGFVSAQLPEADGDTWFFEQELLSDTARPVSMRRTTTGHVLTMALANADSEPSGFRVLAQTTGPAGVREATFDITVPGYSTNTADIPLPCAGAGENSAGIEVRSLTGDILLTKGAIAFRLAPIEDDSFGASLAGPADCGVWWCDATYKVGRERGVPGVTNAAVVVRAARNEIEPFQVVLRPAVSLSNVRVAASSLTSIDHPDIRISSNNVEAFLMDYVIITEPTDSTCVVGDYPDPLVPLTEAVSCPAGTNQPFWFNISVPRELPAGVYQGSLTFSSDQMSIPVAIELRVFDFSLPDTTHTRSSYGFDFYNQWHGTTNSVQRGEVIDLYMRNFAKHRISPSRLSDFWPIGVYPTNVGGQFSYSYDFTNFDAGIARCIEDYKFTAFIPRPVPWWGGSYPGYTPSQWAEYAKLMRPIVEHIRQMGWMDEAFLYAFDEPQNTAAAIATVQEGTGHLEEAVPGMRRLVTTSVQEVYHGAVDIWAPYLTYFDPKAIQARRTAGEEFWWYVSTGPRAPYPNNFIDYPAVDHRVRVWLAQKYGATGELYWQSAWWVTTSNQLRNPWTDPMSRSPLQGNWGNGDGLLLYPPVRQFPAQPVIAGPVNSLRFELLREAMEDGEYFWLLDQAIDRAKARIGPRHPDVVAADATRSEGLDLVSSRTTFERGPQRFYEMRLKLAAAIESLDDGAPMIVAQPRSKVVTMNGSLTLRVDAVGRPPLSFQWFRAGSSLPNATNDVLTLLNMDAALTGVYHVVVSNGAGTATSMDARVEGDWSELPSILRQPVALVRSVGETAVFSVTAVSQNPTTYAWLQDGEPVVGTTATNSTLLLTNLTTAAAGRYSVVLSNVAGAVTSAEAQLIVLSPVTHLTLVSTGAVWRYHDLGVALAPDWVSLSYDDSGWSNGTAQLGYGEGDESTLVASGPGRAVKPVTTYFRHSFTAEPSLPGVVIEGRLLRDDAAIVYVNGTEVYRNNLPEGPIAYDTSALSALDEVQQEAQFMDFSFNGSLLVAGTNVIAVEVHQHTGSSAFAFGPTAYWSLDEPESPWLDSVGTNHFTAVGTGLSVAEGTVGGAVSNTGSFSSYLAAWPSEALDYSGPFTVGGWFAPGSGTSSFATFMGKADEFRLYYTGTYVNRHRFEVNGIYVQDPTSLSAGQWRFLVGWFDGTNAHIQVNNGPVYSAPANAPAATANPLKALSEVPETGSLIGDELFLYKRVLSAGERATLYGNGMRLGDLSFDLAVSRPIAQMPVFTAPPASLVKRVGENAAFNLRAESAFPVSYQWNLNGSPLVGATNGLLFLETVTPADAGTYTLTASNIGGPVTSSPATLTVIPPPTIRVDDGCLGFTGEEFGFCIEGPVGLRATVEVSTNLVDWVPLQTHLVETGTVRCSDPQAGAFTSRFYRARLDAPATP